MDAKGNVYDAFLPPAFAAEYRILYPPIVVAARRHLAQYPFHVHPNFHHMASSQAATLNLFLPILLHPQADAVLRQLKPDFAHLATEQLDHGYRIEFKDKPHADPLDKTVIAAADADIAIAYYNDEDELCLWLVEHKLTEAQFTPCGGCKKAEGIAGLHCHASFAEIMKMPDLCYYHRVMGYKHWFVTAKHVGLFPGHAQFPGCPFHGGMNQLWRNQLLALSTADNPENRYRHAALAVVRHPRNHALDETLANYGKLTGHNPAFRVLTSADVVEAAASVGDAALQAWVHWYRALYKV